MYCFNIDSFNVKDDNPSYCSQNGVLFNKDKTCLVSYPGNKSNSTYEIPEGVENIEEYAFCSCTNLTSIFIPKSMNQINKGAFAFCKSLISINIPDSVTCIEDSAFYSCEKLTDIILPNSIIDIEEYAFEGCDSLTEIVIPNSVTHIGDEAFCGCGVLENVTIGNGVTSIGMDAFSDCRNMRTVTIGKGIASIDGWAFYNCENLTDVYYAGSEEEWASISIGEENTCLTDANIHYNVPGIMDPYLPDEVCSILIQQIESGNEGTTINVDMNEASIIPKYVLEVLNNKNVNLNLTLSNGICWTINGQDVQDNVQDLEVSLIRSEKESGAIPAETINAISGIQEGEQLMFLQDGAFYLTADIILPVDNILEGKKAVLLYYENEALSLTDSDIVKEGKMEFEINQGSEYAVIYAVNGDVNADEKVNIVDLMQVLHHVSGRNTMNALQQGIADTDLNNNVNIVDLMRMLHYVSGRNSTL